GDERDGLDVAAGPARVGDGDRLHAVLVVGGRVRGEGPRGDVDGGGHVGRREGVGAGRGAAGHLDVDGRIAGAEAVLVEQSLGDRAELIQAREADPEGAQAVGQAAEVRLQGKDPAVVDANDL